MARVRHSDAARPIRRVRAVPSCSIDATSGSVSYGGHKRLSVVALTVSEFLRRGEDNVVEHQRLFRLGQSAHARRWGYLLMMTEFSHETRRSILYTASAMEYRAIVHLY